MKYKKEEHSYIDKHMSHPKHATMSNQIQRSAIYIRFNEPKPWQVHAIVFGSAKTNVGDARARGCQIFYWLIIPHKHTQPSRHKMVCNLESRDGYFAEHKRQEKQPTQTCLSWHGACKCLPHVWYLERAQFEPTWHGFPPP